MQRVPQPLFGKKNGRILCFIGFRRGQSLHTFCLQEREGETSCPPCSDLLGPPSGQTDRLFLNHNFDNKAPVVLGPQFIHQSVLGHRIASLLQPLLEPILGVRADQLRRAELKVVAQQQLYR